MAYTIAAASKAAAGQVGYRENGNNDTKFNHWLGTIDGTYRYAWCCSFQGWCADQAGGRANVDYPRTAGCAVAVQWFKAHNRWSSTPHEGDWVFYGPGGGTHVELVVAVSSHSITTIGGNTSGSLDGRYYAGDGVYRKTVSRGSDRIYGYGRPAYSGGAVASEEGDPLLGLKKGDKGERVQALQQMIEAAGQGAALGASGSDGDYGPATAEALRRVRLSVGSDAAKKAGAGDRVDAWAFQQLHSAVARNQGKLALHTV